MNDNWQPQRNPYIEDIKLNTYTLTNLIKARHREYIYLVFKVEPMHLENTIVLCVGIIMSLVKRKLHNLMNDKVHGAGEYVCMYSIYTNGWQQLNRCGMYVEIIQVSSSAVRWEYDYAFLILCTQYTHLLRHSISIPFLYLILIYALFTGGLWTSVIQT